MTIEKHVLEIIRGKKPAPITKSLLYLMSQVYRTGNQIRHLAYDFVIPEIKVSIPVISVGNIVAGGSGKTPFIHYLAEILGPKKVAILSRGYKRKSKKTIVVKKNTPVEECGDEPYMLAKKLPECQIIVEKNRAFSSQLAERMGAKIILLDDGMQYRQLYRNLEIGIMDGNDLFGGGYYLPRGFLRDRPQRLAKTDLIVLNHVKDKTHFETIQSLIRRYTNAPIMAMKLVVENADELQGKKLASFCALATPERFTTTLRELNCDILLQKEKPDHDSFDEKELESFCKQASKLGAKYLVCTEKDAVKLPKNLSLSLPIIPVCICLKPLFGKNHLETILQEVQK